MKQFRRNLERFVNTDTQDLYRTEALKICNKLERGTTNSSDLNLIMRTVLRQMLEDSIFNPKEQEEMKNPLVIAMLLKAKYPNQTNQNSAKMSEAICGGLNHG